jgi:hypothetical protein
MPFSPGKLFSCSKAPAWEQVSQLVWTMNASFLTPAGKSAIVSPMKTDQTTINRKKYLPSHKVFRKMVGWCRLMVALRNEYGQ